MVILLFAVIFNLSVILSEYSYMKNFRKQMCSIVYQP